MKRLLIATALCCTLPFAAKAFATDVGSPFLSETDCFAGASAYESWLQALPGERYGQPLPKESVARVVPRMHFEWAQASLDCRLVSYDNDGLTISGYVVSPKGTAGGKRPIVIYNRGGNSLFGATDSIALFREVFPLVKAGYVVIASQYRGGTKGKPKKVGRDEVALGREATHRFAGVDTAWRGRRPG